MSDYKKYRVVYLHSINVLADSEKEASDTAITQMYAALTYNYIQENIKFFWDIRELDDEDVALCEVFVE